MATKIETPLIETPRSITTIDRRTLDDLGVINITQAHDYAVGLTLLDERGPGFARGFPVEFYDLRRDGLRTYAWSVREPVALDRIQYLRGPDGVLYGDGSPGALVNMVLKKPLPTPRYEVGLSAGSQGFRRFTADLTGPLTDDRRVRYRVVHAGAGRTESDESPLRDLRCRRDVHRGSITTCRAAADDSLLIGSGGPCDPSRETVGFASEAQL